MLGFKHEKPGMAFILELGRADAFLRVRYASLINSLMRHV